MQPVQISPISNGRPQEKDLSTNLGLTEYIMIRQAKHALQYIQVGSYHMHRRITDLAM